MATTITQPHTASAIMASPLSMSMTTLSLADSRDGLVPVEWLFPSPEPTGTSSKPLDISPDARLDIYQPLNANPQQLDVRLLEIHESDTAEGQMSCFLYQVPLERAPEYYALSYHWGDGGDAQGRPMIVVNGHQFPIQPNLWDAMIALRKRGHLTIWADAISLNQADDREKAQQVARMKLIYQKAKGVAIWLGRGDDGSADVMQMLRGMAATEFTTEHQKRVARLLPLVEDENRVLLPPSRAVEFFTSYIAQILVGELGMTIEEFTQGIQDPAQEDLQQIVVQRSLAWQKKFDSFFGRPYWRRLWIIQEVAAARSAAVFCGDECLLWDDLVAVVRVLDDGKVDWNDSTDVGALNVDLIRRLQYKVRNRIPIGLLTALQRSYAFEASRVQDKIYALLGLSWDADRFIQSVSYGKEFTANKIMFDMTKEWSKSGFLDIICLQPPYGNDYSLPSWLPKWFLAGRSNASDRLVDHLENRRPASILSKYGHSWKATDRSKSSDHQFLDHGRVLLIRGVHVDTIDGLSGACESVKDEPSLTTCWDSRCPAPQTVVEMKRIRSDLYWTLNMYKKESGNGIPDQTLNLDVLWSEKVKDQFAKEEWTAMTDWLDALASFRIYGRPFSQWLQNRPKYRNIAKVIVLNKLVRDQNDKTYFDEHEENIVKAFRQVFTDGRRLMTTRRGRVGWAHPAARPGDRIYLIEGCSLPVILAPCQTPFEHYQTCLLVGDAYVHGLMEGSEWERASQQLHDIFLR